MAYEIPGFSFPLPSGADYRSGNGQYRFVKVNTTGQAVQTVKGNHAVGVRQNTPNVNEAMTIVNSGVSLVEAGGAVTAGDLIASDATGRAVKAASGDSVNGEALETAAAAGILVAVLLHNSAAVSA